MGIEDNLEYIELQRLISLRANLHLEIRGVRSKTTPTTYIAVKKEFKFHGNRENVLRQLSYLIEQRRKELYE